MNRNKDNDNDNNNQQKQINDLMMQNAYLKNELKKTDEEKRQIELQRRRRGPSFKSHWFSHGPPKKTEQDDNQIYLNFIQVKL